MYTCIIHIHICTYVYIRKYSPFISYYKDIKMARNIYDW